MYASIEQLIDLFGEQTVRELSNRGDPEGELCTEVLERAILVACSEVDSYLAACGPVPLAAPVPLVVTAATADIVRYRLTSGDLDEKDAILVRYKRTISWLNEVATGKAKLPGVVGDPLISGVDINPGTRPWDGVTP